MGCTNRGRHHLLLLLAVLAGGAFAVWWSYLNWTETRDGGRHGAAEHRGEVQSLLKSHNGARPPPVVRPLSLPSLAFPIGLFTPRHLRQQP